MCDISYTTDIDTSHNITTKNLSYTVLLLYFWAGGLAPNFHVGNSRLSLLGLQSCCMSQVLRRGGAGGEVHIPSPVIKSSLLVPLRDSMFLNHPGYDGIPDSAVVASSCRSTKVKSSAISESNRKQVNGVVRPCSLFGPKYQHRSKMPSAHGRPQAVAWAEEVSLPGVHVLPGAPHAVRLLHPLFVIHPVVSSFFWGILLPVCCLYKFFLSISRLWQDPQAGHAGHPPATIRLRLVTSQWLVYLYEGVRGYVQPTSIF